MNLRDILKSADVRAPGLDGATAWLNSEPLTPDDLRGHVVAYRSGHPLNIELVRALSRELGQGSVARRRVAEPLAA